jgi:subtilase family serine protease/fibronectin type 3 domain-containing protein
MGSSADWRKGIVRLRTNAAKALAVLSLVATLPSHADAPAPTVFPNTGAYTATLQSVQGDVAVIEINGDYSRNLADGSINVEPRTVIAKSFLKNFADNYDFIVAFSNFEFNTGDATAFYTTVKNDTKGLGQPLFDNGTYFGSAGHLQGFVDMAATSRYTLSPSDARFENVMMVLSHELLHRWAAHVQFLDEQGKPSNALLGRDAAHWSFLLDTGGSVEYGNRWKDNGDGTFTSQPDQQYYSPLDLYLMGMLKKEQVPPFFYIEAPSVDATRLPQPGVTVAGVRHDVTIDQVIAASGARDPSADGAQKQFKIGFVLLTRPGVTPSTADLQGVDAVRTAFQARLTALTGGQAIAHVFLQPLPGAAPVTGGSVGAPVLGAPGTQASVNNAVTWLQQKQASDGSWSDHPFTQLRDTALAMATLQNVGAGSQSAVAQAKSWIAAHSFSNTDYAARRIVALGTQATDADWSGLSASQNADGGWGPAPGYQSTPLDTALAMSAMALDANSVRQAAAMGPAAAFLVKTQNPDGGWSHAVSGASRLFTTSEAVVALASQGQPAAIESAVQFIAAHQHADGGFGDTQSTSHDTANVLLALAQAAHLSAVRAPDAYAFLNVTQHADGSWDGGIYATAMAVRALGVASAYNWTAQSLAASPTSVPDGQRVALTLTVSNTGSLAAPATTAKIYDGDPANGVVLTEIPVPPLDAGRSTQVQGSWSTFNAPGNHLLQAVVDPAAAGAEITREDNSASVRVAVSPAPVQPDLSVTTADLLVLPQTINRLPASVSVTAQVSNLGQTDANAVKVELLMGPSTSAMTVVDTKIVNLIGRSTVPVSLSAQLAQAGAQQLAVVIDPDNAVADPNRQNNRADTRLSTTPALDVAVAASDIVPSAAQVNVGGDMSFQVTLHNYGTVDSPPFQAVISVSDGTNVHQVAQLQVQLPAGGAKTLSLPWRVDLAGALNVNVSMDPAGALADVDRSNNMAAAALTATPVTGPNLAISFTDFIIAPTPLNEGSPAQLKATVRNTGTEAAANVEVGFYEGDPTAGGTLLAPIQVIPSLGAGASTVVTVQTASVVGTADRLYFVAIDPAGKLTESSKDDNNAFLALTVNALPDLATSTGDMHATPGAPKPGDQLALSVNVSNLGEQAANNVVVRLFDGAGTSGTPLGDVIVPTVAAQATVPVQFSVALPNQAATQALTVVIDPDNAIAEGSKANNVAMLSLQVQSGSGYVSEPYFSPNGDGVKDTTSFGFSMPAANVVQLRVVDDKGKPVRTLALPGAAPLQQGSVGWDGRDDLQRVVGDGTYTFQALDAGGNVVSQAQTALDTNRMPILRASGTPYEYYQNLSCRSGGFSDWTTTLDEQSVFFTSNGSQTTLKGIYKIALEGGDTQTVVSAPYIDQNHTPNLLSASERGEKLAFEMGVYKVNPQTGYYTSSDELWTVDGTGSNLVRLLTNDSSQPSYSSYSSIQNVVMAHDGKTVTAAIGFPYDSQYGYPTVLQRFALDGSGQVTTLYDSRNPDTPAAFYDLSVAPNRSRALIRLNGQAGSNYAVIDFETGQLTMLPAGFYPNGVEGLTWVWSPDSNLLAAYGRLSDLGLPPGSEYDYNVDVFDTHLNLQRRFRTQSQTPAPRGGDSYYGGDISNVEWSGASDELLFSVSVNSYIPEFRAAAAPTGGRAKVQGVHARTQSQEGPYGEDVTVYRASVSSGTLTIVPTSPDYWGPDGGYLWAPNDRLAIDGPSSSLDVDSGASGALFQSWFDPKANPNGANMSIADFAPSGRRLYFLSSRDSSNPLSACYQPDQPWNYQLYAYQSLQNLVADLQPMRDPTVGGMVINGTATDINFSTWQLDYANTLSPTDWHSITVPSTEQKVGVQLATWVPPTYGTFFVRLSVLDLAGNATQVVRRVNWSDTPAITDLQQNSDYFSPNGDGVLDGFSLSYRVVEPVHLLFEVFDAKGQRVRMFERDHPSIGGTFSFDWDGRNDDGQAVPDGKYTIKVLDYQFSVVLDTQSPEIDFDYPSHGFVLGGPLQGPLSDDDLLQHVPGPVPVMSDDDDVQLLSASVTGFDGHTVPGANAPVLQDADGEFMLSWDATGVADGAYLVDVQYADAHGAGIATMFVAEVDHSQPVPVTFSSVGSYGGMGATLDSEIYDPLLDQKSGQLEEGQGDPAGNWQVGCLAGSPQSQSGMPGVSATCSVSPFDPTIDDVGAGVNLDAFLGLRLRVSARDLAGNASSIVTPVPQVNDLVLASGLADFWLTESPAKVGKKGVTATDNYTTGASPAGVLVLTDPNDEAKFEQSYGIAPRLLELQYFDTMVSAPTRAVLQYQFLPILAGHELDPLVPPTTAQLAKLAWTTVPLTGLSAGQQQPGISSVVVKSHSLAFNWQLPQQSGPGYWMWRVVQSADDGSQTVSNAAVLTAATSAPAGKSMKMQWGAYLEPAQSCGAPVSEIAHLSTTFSEAVAPISALRWYWLKADGSSEEVGELSFEPVSDATKEVTVATSQWPVGRQNLRMDAFYNGVWNQGAASPYVVIDHAGPQVRVTSPLPNQQMCATHIVQADGSTVGYVPLALDVQEPYASLTNVYLESNGGLSPRGPVAIDGAVFPSGPPTPPAEVVCSLPNGCGPGPQGSRAVFWPGNPGVAAPLSGRLYGLLQDDGKQLNLAPLDGTIHGSVHVYGPSGHLACAPVDVQVDGHVDARSTIDVGLFSPNGDGLLDTVTATVTAGEPVTVKVEVVPAMKGSWGYQIVPGAEPVALLATGLQMGNGGRPFPWDGHTSAGSIAADGMYAFRVTSTDGCGNVQVEVLGFELDNTPPQIVLSNPTSGESVVFQVPVRGTLTDLHPLRSQVRAIADANPQAPLLLADDEQGGTFNKANLTLTTWDTTGLLGGVTLRVEAWDAAGNHSLLDVPVTVPPPVDVIADLSVAPDPFSPNGDGRRETATVNFTLLKNAELTLQVLRNDPAHTVVRTLLNKTAYVTGNFNVVWNGKTDAGSLDVDETAIVMLTADSPDGVSPPFHQSVSVPLTLDKTPPVITFTQPATPVTTGAVGVIAAANDPLYASSQLLVAVNGGGYTVLADGDTTGHLRGDLSALPEGPIQLKVQAADLAENQSESVLNAIIDRTPPKVAVTAPAPNAYVSGLKQPLAIEGTVDELHLDNFELLLAPAESSQKTVLSHVTALPTKPQLLSWDPKTVDDGDYILTLHALDQAGLQGQTDVPFTVDNTPPTASITSTGDPMYVKLGTVLAGTAKDTNYQTAVLDIAPVQADGGAARWSPLAAAMPQVDNATLHTFGVLPVDGAYMLRLTVTDKAGNQSTAQQAVTVDTTPPAQVLNLVAQLQDQKDAHLSWTAATEPDLAGYELFRNGARVNTSALLTTNTYVDAGLAAGAYTYTVKAVDRAGNEGQTSNPASVMVVLGTPVAQIFAPVRESYVSGIVNITGTASAPSSFKEYRVSIGGGRTPTTWTLLRSSPISTTADTLAQWNTLQLNEGAQYTIKLEAEDVAGNVATDLATVTVDNLAPHAPLQLQGTPSGSDVALSWTASIDPDLAGYLLYRDGKLVNAPTLVIGSLLPYAIKPTSYNDVGVPDGLHTYYVQAIDNAGNVSDPSNSVQVTIDTRPPHVTITQPADGTKVGQAASLVGTSPDTDIATVQFEYKLPADGSWTNIGAPVTTEPWNTVWSLQGVPYGSYQVRAVATDKSGKTDPNPGYITLVVTDLRPPQAATNLTAHVTGGTVTLNWVASSSNSTDTPVSYQVERVEPDGSVTQLTTDPVSGLSYVDANLADAAYVYRVIAFNAQGVEGGASNDAPARVFTPAIVQPYTPTADTAFALKGSTYPALQLSVTGLDGTPVASVASDDAGAFALAGVPAALGDNQLLLVAADAQGNTSKTVQFHVVRGVAPAMPVGLQPTADSQQQITLGWTANTEPDLAGYLPALDGVVAEEPLSPTAATASSTWSSSSYYAPYQVLDNNDYSYWLADYTLASPQWIQLTLPAKRMVDRVNVSWYPYDGPPSHYELQGYDGQVWVPLADVDNSQEFSHDIVLSRPYRTDQLRVTIPAHVYAPLSGLHAFAEVETTATSYVFAGAADGYRQTGVQAFSQLGLVSPRAEAKVAVGDVTPPDAPVLQASVQNDTDVQLTWVEPTGDNNADVTSFIVRRDGVQIAQVDASVTSYLDASRPNGHYVYTVVALDAAANQSAPSNEAPVDIAVVSTPAPITATAQALPDGGAIEIDWTLGAGQAPDSYALHRSLTAGGPYTDVATGLTGTGYVDTTVTNGVRYYYIVTSADAQGNAASVSNEVSALANDTVAPEPPFFLYPGQSPGPVQTTQPLTDIVGMAEPGSTVSLSNNGSPLGTVHALDDDQWSDHYAYGQVFDLAADGSRIYLSNPDEGPSMFTADGTPVPAASLSNVQVRAFRFAPDGRSAAVINYDNNVGQEVLSRWDAAHDTLTQVSSSADVGILQFSPDGKRVVAAAWNEATQAIGLLVVDWATGNTRWIDGDFDSASWSPDGSTLAVVNDEDQTLHLLKPDTGDDVPVTAVTGAGNPAWLPDGQSLLVEEQRNGQKAIGQVAVPSLAVTDIAMSSDPYSMPIVSPRGDAFLVYRGNSLVVHWMSGGEDLVDDYVDDPYESTKPVWSSAGSYMFRSDWSDYSYVQPAGQFRLSGTRLSQGTNTFDAYASDAAGNGSGPAPSLQVQLQADTRADLAIDASGIVVLPAAPIAAQATNIGVTVKNVGASASGQAPVSLVAVDDAGQVTQLGQPVLNALAAGGQQTLSFNWTPPVAGHYVLIAVADPAGTLDEVTQANNQASREVLVAAVQSGQPQLSVTTAAAHYTGGSTVSATVTVATTGAAFDGTLAVRITDAAGYEVTRFDARPVQQLLYGQPQTFTYSWPSGQTLAGDYRVVAQLQDPASQDAADGSVGFAIDAGVTLDAAVTTDRAQYASGDTVTVHGNVHYAAGNEASVSAPALLQVLDANGTVVASQTMNIQSLSQGGDVQGELTWTAGAAGQYATRLQVGTPDAPLAQATGQFAVGTATAPNIAGHLVPTLTSIDPRESLSAAYTLSDTGSPLQNVAVRVRAVPVPGTVTLAQWSGSVAVLGSTPVSGTATLNATWPVGTVQLNLEVQLANSPTWTLLDHASVQVVQQTPPGLVFTSPAPGAVVRSSSLVDATATVQQAPVAKVELSWASGVWAPMQVLNPNAGTYASVALPAADGPYTLQARATDTLGNQSAVVQLPLVIDNTPPAIVVTGVADQQMARTVLTPVVTVTDANPATQSIQLDGAPWSSGPVGEGSHALQVSATDKAGNTASKTVQFTVDLTAPVIAITGVTDGASYLGSATPVITVTDAHLASSQTTLDGAAYASGQAVTAVGRHALVVHATDEAGNESSRSLSFQVQAVSLSGGLTAQPAQAPLGVSVVLDGNVGNGTAVALQGVQIELVLRDHATGTVLKTFTDSADLAASGTYQHAWTWTAAGTAGQVVDAVLQATYAGNAYPVATASIQLEPAQANFGLVASLTGPRNLLVFARCPRLEDAAWDNCGASHRVFSDAAAAAACDADHATWLDQYLTGQNVPHTVVTDEQSFLQALRSGLYSGYWLSGDALTLGVQAASEVQAAVIRGDLLLVDGWSQARNTTLETVSGVKFLGPWSTSTGTVATSGVLYPVASYAVSAPTRLSMATDAVRQATLNNGPGVVSHNYGAGHALAFAFDLAGTLRNASATVLPTWTSVVQPSVQTLQGAVPDHTAANGVARVQVELTNQGSGAQPVDYTATLPAQSSLLQADPQATESTTTGNLPTLRWRQTVDAGASFDIGAALRVPPTGADYVLASLLNQVNPDGSSSLLQSQQLTLHVLGADALVSAAATAAQSTDAGAATAAKTEALGWLAQAQISVQAEAWQDALRQLLAAQAAWQGVAGPAGDAARLAIAQAIESVERRL